MVPIKFSCDGTSTRGESHQTGWEAGECRIRRLSFADTFEQLPPCIVGVEACLSAHFVSRKLRALGHEPRIIRAIYVKPFMKGQKNDYNDAEAIAGAALRPNPRVVQEKSQDELDL